MPSPFVGELDLSKVHFMPMTNADGKKSVQFFLDDTSTANSNKVWFQLAPNEDDPNTTRYGLDSVRDDQPDATRRGLTFIVTNPRAVAALLAFDKAVVAEAVKKSKEWFKKPLTEYEVLMRYKPVLSRASEEDDYLMKAKVKCTGSKVPTKIYRLVDGGVKPADEQLLGNRGARVVPIVSAFGLWFMGDGVQFGASFQVEEMLVVHVEEPSVMSNFSLKRPLAAVKHDEAEDKDDATKVELVGEEESAM